MGDLPCFADEDDDDDNVIEEAESVSLEAEVDEVDLVLEVAPVAGVVDALMDDEVERKEAFWGCEEEDDDEDLVVALG